MGKLLTFGRHRGRYDRQADLLASLMRHNQGRHRATG